MEDPRHVYRILWMAFLGLWGTGRQHRWRLHVLRQAMDLVQTEIPTGRWLNFAPTLPGFTSYHNSVASWRAHHQ